MKDLKDISDTERLQVIKELMNTFWHKYPAVHPNAAAGSIDLIYYITNNKVVKISPIMWTGKFLKKFFKEDHLIWNWIKFTEIDEECIEVPDWP